MADQRNPRPGQRPPPIGRGAAPRQDPTESLRDIFPEYLRLGYFEDGRLREPLIRRTTMDRLARAMASARPALTSNQARRIFQHCRAIEDKLRRGRSSWEEEKTNVLRLDGFAAEARNKSKVPSIFEEFIKVNVSACQDQRDFVDGFMPHFEALIAFGSAHLRERG